MLNILFIGIGGFLGAVFRFLISKILNSYLPSFPFGTLVVNVSGSFLLGLIVYGTFNGKNLTPQMRDFAAAGFIGAFTTMSAFAYESFRMIELSQYLQFGLNIFLNIFLSILAVYAGKELGIFLSR